MNLIEQALSPNQLKNIFRHHYSGPLRVVEYDEVIRTPNLLTLFSNANFVIIFYPAAVIENQTVGHYCALVYHPERNLVDFYDPLAYKPDEYKKFSDRSLYFERENSLIRHLLTLSNNNFTIDYNHYQHQSRQPNVATCGRHCVLRCLFGEFTNKQYNKMLRVLCKQLKLNPRRLKDELVVTLINFNPH